MKVFKLKKETEPGVTIIEVRSELLSASEDKLLGSLPGDLFLVFPRSVTSGIDPEKFSNLYGATWYGVGDGDEVTRFWEALDYLESLSKYTSMSIVRERFWIPSETLEALKRLQYSLLEKSVFDSQELGGDEKAEIYTIKPRLLEILFGYRFRLPGKKTKTGLYSRRSSRDNIFFLRPQSVSGIREILSPDILHSFSGLGIGSFLASMIPPETHLNSKIDEAKI